MTRDGDREGNRLLVDAENFLSESHTFLYVGVALTSIAAGVGIFLVTRYGELRTKSFTIAFKLLLLRQFVVEFGHVKIIDQNKSQQLPLYSRQCDSGIDFDYCSNLIECIDCS